MSFKEYSEECLWEFQGIKLNIPGNIAIFTAASITTIFSLGKKWQTLFDINGHPTQYANILLVGALSWKYSKGSYLWIDSKMKIDSLHVTLLLKINRISSLILTAWRPVERILRFTLRVVWQPLLATIIRDRSIQSTWQWYYTARRGCCCCSVIAIAAWAHSSVSSSKHLLNSSSSSRVK